MYALITIAISVSSVSVVVATRTPYVELLQRKVNYGKFVENNTDTIDACSPARSAMLQIQHKVSAWQHLSHSIEESHGGLKESFQNNNTNMPPRTLKSFDPLMIRNQHLAKLHDFIPSSDLCASVRSDSNNKMVHLSDHVVFKKSSQAAPRIFCLVFTVKCKHAKNARALLETWLPKCDGALLVSNAEDKALGGVTLEHTGEDTSDNLWQKLRAGFQYVHDNYLQQFDYFLKADDDSYIFVENLRHYLSTAEIHDRNSRGEPLYIGRRFKMPNTALFNAGAGYLLNRVALQRFYKSLSHCQTSQVSHADDAILGVCLMGEGVEPMDTRDVNGRERFHPFNPQWLASYIIPAKPSWYENYTFDVKEGLHGVAPDSCVFHYVNDKDMYRLDKLLHGCHKNNSINNIKASAD